MTDAKIMIVEDEGIVAEDIKIQLEKYGYDVAAIVMYGEEALETARNKRPDLVIMDIALRGRVNGLEAATAIRSELKIPIVFLTANISNEIMDQAKPSEPFGYLLKPLHPVELFATIEMALNKAEIEREKERLALENRELIQELREALNNVKRLEGLIPICANCKKVRSDVDYWQQIEKYVQDRSMAKFSHTICPECAKMLYPDLDLNVD